MRKQDVILNLVSEQFGVEKHNILSRGRSRDVSMAKHMFVFLLREHCGMTLTKIANELGKDNYDHSSVIYAFSKMKNAILTKEMPAYDIYKAIIKNLRENETLQLNLNPKLIVRYPKGFNIQEVIQFINSKYKNLEYELI